MPKCARKSCGKEFDLANNQADACTFHPGGPVFHEGLKSWSCCGEFNKPVLEFEQFVKIPGCASGPHTEEAQVEPTKAPPTSKVTKSAELVDGKEVYTSGPPPVAGGGTTTAPVTTAMPTLSAPEVIIEEEDDLSIPVPVGTVCRRKACGTAFVSDEVNRIGDGDATVCRYHSAPPMFREGSKGYLCCKRRVLEFDEFMKIEGCKTGRHLFAPKATPSVAANVEEIVDCRMDHYQTPSEVHVSVFAKKCDKEKSKVTFEEDKMHLDLFLPSSKRCKRTVDLFGNIKSEESTVRVLGTKVEIILRKADGKSWTVLEKTTQDLGPLQFTFGTSGRTGTVGSKVIAQ